MARLAIKELAQEVDRGPDRLAVDSLRGRAHDDPEEAHEREPERNADELREARCGWRSRARCEVGSISTMISAGEHDGRIGGHTGEYSGLT